MLPERYIGPVLPKFVVVAFNRKVFFLLCHWGFNNAPGFMRKWEYENFLIEVNLYGNPFLDEFETFGCVPTNRM